MHQITAVVLSAIAAALLAVVVGLGCAYTLFAPELAERPALLAPLGPVRMLGYARSPAACDGYHCATRTPQPTRVYRLMLLVRTGARPAMSFVLAELPLPGQRADGL